ncbi:hypothetical protein NL676_032469 [Syzygium grande]|nr:hypothetical protein NL676_032469 [Syzygium grande]
MRERSGRETGQGPSPKTRWWFPETRRIHALPPPPIFGKFGFKSCWFVFFAGPKLVFLQDPARVRGAGVTRPIAVAFYSPSPSRETSAHRYRLYLVLGVAAESWLFF